MKRSILTVILVLFAFCLVYSQNNAPIDLILLLNTSSGMSSSYENVNDYITGSFLSEYLRAGDTFHLIVFSQSPRLDIARRINQKGDVETIIGRMLLQYPVENGYNPAAAITFTENYVSSLPSRPKKIVLVSTGDQELNNAVNAARNNLRAKNTTFDFVQVTSGQPLSNLPKSGRDAVTSGTGAAGVSNQGTGAASGAASVSGTANQGASVSGTANQGTSVSGTANQGTTAGENGTTGTVSAQGSQEVSGTAESGSSVDDNGKGENSTSEKSSGGETASGSEKTSGEKTSESVKTSSGSGGSSTSSTGFIILIIFLILLVIGAVIFFATRRRGSDDRRPVAPVLPPKQEPRQEPKQTPKQEQQKKKQSPVIDNRRELANYAAQSKQRTTPYSNKPSRPDNSKQFTIDPTGTVIIRLFVEDQSLSIGKRNIHSLKSGYSLTVGGGNSDYLIFLVPVPPHIGEIHRNGSQLTFIPRKYKYFPDLGSNELRDCLNKTIRIVSDKNYEIHFRFELYEDPLLELNRVLQSIKVPG